MELPACLAKEVYMWNIIVLTAMLSLVGYYATRDQQYVTRTGTQASANGLAEDMAIYRQAVIAYYSANPGAPSNAGAGTSELTGAGVFPAWADAPLLCAQWRNYIDENRMIFIYAAGPLSTDIVANIVSMSGNSVLVGQAQTSGTRLVLYAPADIPTAAVTQTTQIPAATDYGAHPSIVLPAGAGIPVGSPVWLFQTN